MRDIVIGTRSSELAVLQTRTIIDMLQKAGYKHEFHIKTISTKGDRNVSDPLHRVGRKGIFSTDLQEALDEGKIDFAVHSLKDLSLYEDKRFKLASFPTRADHRDAYVDRTNVLLKDLKKGSVIGTSSPRRRAFIQAHYPHVRTKTIRGPVEARLEQLRQGKYDGLMLAVAGLERLDLTETITEYLDIDQFIPAFGQGALALECRRDDEEVVQMLRSINDESIERSVLTEREFVRLLDPDDEAPIGAYAEVKGDEITLHGSVTSLDGEKLIIVQVTGTHIEKVANEAAEEALAKGAEDVIERAKEGLALR